MLPLSHEVMKRFVSDYNIPISVLDHFDYFINLYGYQKELNDLNTVIDEVGEDLFLKMSFIIQENIIWDIKKNQAYLKFNSIDMNQYRTKINIGKQKLFDPTHDKCHFISLDLKKANYQSLRYVDPSIVNNSKDYNDFISQYTNYDYFKNSKKLRQIIFGNVNPSRQQTVQKYMVSIIIQYLIDAKICCEDDCVLTSSDEVIFKSVDIYEPLEDILKHCSIDVSLNKFQLIHLKPYNFYTQNSIDSIKLKCVPSYFYPQVYKFVHNMPLNDRDLEFFYEGQIAQFKNKLTFE